MRKIIHVDMDCFYAAVEVKKNPLLRGKPLGIGGPANSRSVLCTASYEARKFGVRSAMPSSHAARLCPQIILIPPDFQSYKNESRAVRKIFERFTSKIEPLSLDEAYLDVTDSKMFQGSATRIAYEIRRMIYEELHLTASTGVATNKFLAKIASDWHKPNGQFVILPEEIAEFVRVLPIEKIHGVGSVTAKKMHQLGLYTCEDIQKQSIEQLRRWFGRRGEDLARISRGIDNREVKPDWQRKSLSVEQTYNKDLQGLEECLAEIPELYADWIDRIQRSGVQSKIKNISVKLKFHDFKTTTHESSITDFPQIEDFKKLFSSAWRRREEAVRLIGLGAQLLHLEAESQSALSALVKNEQQLNFAIDSI